MWKREMHTGRKLKETGRINLPDKNEKKRQNNPCTGLDRPCGVKEVEDPRFIDNRNIKVVRSSVPLIGRIYSPGNIPGTHFC
jgi:hypothetical protein